MTNLTQSAPYLLNQRSFPQDPQALSIELNKTYIDTAIAVNSRTIGVYPTNQPIANGEEWYVSGGNQKQQGVRRVYTFTTTAAITHQIQVIDPNQFTNCFGSYTDGTNSYGLFFASSVAIAGQTTFYVTATQIVFVVGAGAPALTSGRIVLQWLSVKQGS